MKSLVIFLGALRDDNREYTEAPEVHCCVLFGILVRAGPRKLQDFDSLLCHVVRSNQQALKF